MFWQSIIHLKVTELRLASQEANLVEEVEDSPHFWSGPVQSYNSLVEHRFLIGLDRSTNGPLPDCDRKFVSVRTMSPGIMLESTLLSGLPRSMPNTDQCRTEFWHWFQCWSIPINSSQCWSTPIYARSSRIDLVSGLDDFWCSWAWVNSALHV